jgi:hypothetical protein
MGKATAWSTAAVLLVAAVSLGAQSRTLPGGELKVVTVTVEAIDSSRREVTVKKADGALETFYVPQAMKRFDTLKVGDKITAKYYDTIVLTLKEPGSAAVDKTGGALVPVEGAPAGTMSYQRTITTTITAIDPKVPSVTFSGPKGWKYSSRVNDKAALAKVKVGDRVDITWTMAVIMSIE